MDKNKSFIPCGICNLMYDESTVLENINQDACCADCFKKTLCLENQTCQKNFGDNQNAIPQHAQASKNNRNSNSRKLIPKPEIYVHDPNFLALQLSASTASILSVSKRTHTSSFEFQPEQPQPVMMVMVARIPNCSSEDSERDMVKEDKTFVTAHQKHNNVEEVFRPEDRIIVWVASNVSINLSYTVAVSTLDNEIRQKYFGPMLTMNEAPEKLCRDGNCLILTQLHCIPMSNNGMIPMGLDVVIHGPD